MYLYSLISFIFIIQYVITGIWRLMYPYELWWFEGNSLEQSLRVLIGQIYVRPTPEYIAMIYNPLYFIISAIFIKIFGVHLYSIRLVSLAASLGSLFLLFQLVHQKTKKQSIGVLCAGLFAATYYISGAMWDTARVDSLAVFFLLYSIYISRIGIHLKHHTYAAFLFFLSCFTKQSIIFFIPFTCIYYLLEKRKFVLYYLTTCIVLLGASIIVLNAYTHNWFFYYTMTLPQKHSYEIKNFVFFLISDSIKIFPMLIITVLYLVSVIKNKIINDYFYVIIISGLTILSILGRLNIGGASNTLIPFHIALSIGTALGVSTLYTISKKNNLVLPATMLILLQFCMLFYNPLDLVPSKNTEIETKKIISFINKQSETVFIPSNTFLLNFSHHPSQANMHMATELWGGFGDRRLSRPGIDILDRIKNNLIKKMYSIIILEEYDLYTYYYELIKDDIEANYKKSAIMFSIWKGQREIPVYIYIKKK